MATYQYSNPNGFTLADLAEVLRTDPLFQQFSNEPVAQAYPVQPQQPPVEIQQPQQEYGFAYQQPQYDDYAYQPQQNTGFNPAAANAQLSDLLKGSTTTGGWTDQESGVPLLSLVGGGGPQGFQGIGKYANPAEFARTDPAGFAALNPSMAGMSQTAAQQPNQTMEQRKKMIEDLMTPVVGMYGRPDEAKTAANRVQALKLMQEWEKAAVANAEAQSKIEKNRAEARKAEAEAIAKGKEPKDPDAVRTQKWAMQMYQSMPKDDPMTQAFGEKHGLASKPTMDVKLKPGERYNKDTGEVELVPGTDAYNKRLGEIADKKAEYRAFETAMKTITERTADLMQDKGFAAATGWLDSMLPVWASLSPSEKADAKSKITNLNEYLQTRGLADLRASGVAPGSITEREWSKFAAIIGNLDPELSDKEFEKQLNKIKQYVTLARTEIKAKEKEDIARYGNMWDSATKATGNSVTLPNGKVKVFPSKAAADAFKAAAGL